MQISQLEAATDGEGGNHRRPSGSLQGSGSRNSTDEKQHLERKKVEGLMSQVNANGNNRQYIDGRD